MKQTVLNRDGETGSLFVTPKAFLDSLSEKVNKILTFLENSSGKDQVGDYITEPEAQKLLGRKTTWFWSLRKRGLLSFAKVGNKIFYSRRDIEKLLENHKTKSMGNENR
jgi:hypothetical protein